MNNDIVIRASSLPSVSDCMRRTVYKGFGNRRGRMVEILKEAGFNPPESEKSGAAALVGTSAHAFSMTILEAKIAGHDISGAPEALISDAKDAANDAIAKELSDRGVEWDAEIQNRDKAFQLVMSLGAAFMEFADTFNPMEVEFSMSGLLAKKDGDSPAIYLSGHGDIREVDFRIRDLKFGRKAAGYQFQLGAYAILSKAEGKDANGLTIDHFPRKKQVEYRRSDYDTMACGSEAFKLLQRTIESIKAFEKSGNPGCFHANPSSQLCSQKWCPAFGTKFCKLGETE